MKVKKYVTYAKKSFVKVLYVHKKIAIVLHNGTTYDYHFIIKQLAEDFKGQFECLGENTEKYITFFGTN